MANIPSFPISGQQLRDTLTSINDEVGAISGGTDGASAYEIWIAAGNSGTEAEFLASLEGADGADGDDGADGAAVLNGTGAPASGLGVDGDFYIDTDAAEIYGPKTSGAWGVATSLVGPAGADGQDGADGVTPDLSGYIKSDTVQAGGGLTIENSVVMTRSDYDALATPDPATVYKIIEG